MKRLCSLRNETLLPKSKKMDLLAKVAGEDKVFEGERVRIHCKYALPEESAKQEAWKIITEKNSTNLSRKMIEEVINAF
jgi:vacuolar-type H+-ATPase catalytic subunit A/Vma1